MYICWSVMCIVPFPAQGTNPAPSGKPHDRPTDLFFRLTTLCTHLSGTNLSFLKVANFCRLLEKNWRFFFENLTNLRIKDMTQNSSGNTFWIGCVRRAMNCFAKHHDGRFNWNLATSWPTYKKMVHAFFNTLQLTMLELAMKNWL